MEKKVVRKGKSHETNHDSQIRNVLLLLFSPFRFDSLNTVNNIFFRVTFNSFFISALTYLSIIMKKKH